MYYIQENNTLREVSFDSFQDMAEGLNDQVIDYFYIAADVYNNKELETWHWAMNDFRKDTYPICDSIDYALADLDEAIAKSEEYRLVQIENIYLVGVLSKPKEKTLMEIIPYYFEEKPRKIDINKAVEISLKNLKEFGKSINMTVSHEDSLRYKLLNHLTYFTTRTFTIDKGNNTKLVRIEGLYLVRDKYICGKGFGENNYYIFNLKTT